MTGWFMGLNTPVSHPCPACDGRGAARIIDKVQVNIPAGVDDGDRVRLPGRGEAGHMGGAAGDLYVEVRVAEHETFTRRGSDLHAVISVEISEAALGTEIEVTTLNGEERLQIPAGSQPGDVFRLRGKGMPSVRSQRKGDIYLTLEVFLPTACDVSAATRWGEQFNSPMAVVSATVQKGKLPAEKSFVEVLTPEIFLSAIKKAEDGKGIVVRVFDMEGKKATAKIRISDLVKKNSKVVETDVLERPLAKSSAKMTGDTVSVTVPAFGQATVKIG